MSTPSISINGLAAESLAHIFSFLPPDERVRLERVCRKWQKVARKYAWTEFRALEVDRQELVMDLQGSYLEVWAEAARARAERRQRAAIKLQALIDRCGPYMREFCFPYFDEFKMETEQWAKMRNLRHLCFETCLSSSTLRAIVEKLPRLQSIYFYETIVSLWHLWLEISELRHLLRVDNASLQALRLPVSVSTSRGKSFYLPALPCSLRSLQLNDDIGGYSPLEERNPVDELLELAVSCCPQLAMLMLPTYSSISRKAWANLARFEKLFYLRLSFNRSDVDLFADTLAKIGPQLRALMLEDVDSRYLQLPWGLPLAVEFIVNLTQLNPLRKMICALHEDCTTAELGQLRTVLQNMDRPLELELIDHCPPELKLGKASKVRVSSTISPERPIQMLLREFWAQAVDSVPDLINLDG